MHEILACQCMELCGALSSPARALVPNYKNRAVSSQRNEFRGTNIPPSYILFLRFSTKQICKRLLVGATQGEQSRAWRACL